MALVSFVASLMTSEGHDDPTNTMNIGHDDPGTPAPRVTWGPNPPAIYARRVIENMMDPHHLDHFPKMVGCEACDRGKVTFGYIRKESSKFKNIEKDDWVETEEAWVRVHAKPRKSLFSPVGVKGGPDLEDIEDARCTFVTYDDDTEETIEDEYSEHSTLDRTWTGFT